jgi:hypothetical protein
MFRTLVIAALLATSAPALARIGPEIAFTTSTEVYLINPDGSGKVRLYRSKSNDYISSIALRPDGGQIAIVENWALKFIDYSAAGRVIGTIRTIRPGCVRLADVHYHPDGNSVLYSELCASTREVKQVSVPTSANPNPAPTTHLSDPDLIDIAWDPSGNSFVYSKLVGNQMELRRHYIDGTPDPIDPLLVSPAGATDQVRYPDVSGDGTRILYSSTPMDAGAYPGAGFTSEIDATSGVSIRSNFISGRKARYAPDNLRIVFIVANSFNDKSIRYREANGTIRQVAGRNNYSAVDWGN